MWWVTWRAASFTGSEARRAVHPLRPRPRQVRGGHGGRELDAAGQRAGPGRAVQVDSVRPSCLELNATRLIILARANDVPSNGNAGQVETRIACTE